MKIKLYDFQGECVEQFTGVLRYVGYFAGKDMFLDVYYSYNCSETENCTHIRCADYLNFEVIL